MPSPQRVLPRAYVDWKTLGGAMAVVLTVFLVYFPALRGEFVWDDDLLVTGNPLLRSVSGLAEIWSGSRTPDYLPLTNTILWLEFHFFGQNPAGYHAFNILLHATNALLIWMLLRKLNVNGGWLAAMIFAIHPLHAESVGWISELKNVLSMFFALLSILCFIRANGPAYLASIFLFGLALLSKTQIVFLSGVLLLVEWWRSGKVGWRAVARTAPFFAMSILAGVATIWFQNRGIGDEDIPVGSIARRFANAGMAVWWYVGKLLCPVRLMAVYPNWRFDSPRPTEWLPLIALVVLVTFLWLRRNRGTRDLFFAIACFILALLPALGFLRMAYIRSGTLVANHFQYLADFPLIALFSAAVVSISKRGAIVRGIVYAGIVLVLAAAATSTWTQAELFQNEEAFWLDTLSKNPKAWQGHARLGQRFVRRERYAEAIPHLERAIELKPEIADHYNLLGLAYCRVERFEEGIAQYRRALELKLARSTMTTRSSLATIHTNLANALAITAGRLGHAGASAEATARYKEAVREYEEALVLEPEQPGIHRNFGLLLAALGRNDEAIAQFRIVLKLVPNEPVARETLAELESQRLSP
jgi:tetratricopeptide (TPR) repeat protein